MKKLLGALALLIVSLAGFSQTTVVNQLQLKTGMGAAPNTVLPVNGGLAYVDVNGYIKKSTVQALLGKKVDSAQRINDSTLQFNTIYGSYQVVIRGLYDVATKAWVDSLHSGKIKDTTVLVNLGGGRTKLAYTGNLADSVYISTLGDSADIKWIQYPDKTVIGYFVHTAVVPGTYGDGTHVPRLTVDSNGRITGVTLVTITGGASGALTKKTINAQGGTTYTVVASDSNTYITSNSASPVTISVPDDATSAIAPPVSIEVYQLGAGKVSFQPLNTNITLNGRNGKLRTAGQYSKVVINKISANYWVLSGDLDTATVGYLTTSLNSLSGFSTTAGTASSPQSFTVSGFNLTAGAVVSAPTNYEVSLDNTTYASTRSISLSGSSLASQPVTVYVRITSSAATGTVSGNVSITSTGVSTVVVSVTGTNTSTSPTITTSVSSLGAFTTTQGTASSSQTFTASGANLTADVTVTAPSGFEISKDNVTYTSPITLTHSGSTLVGQPVTVYVRVASSTTAGSYSGNVALSSSGATTQNVAVTATVNSSAATVAKWNFSSTTQTVSGWNNMPGNPGVGLTSTDVATGWVLSTNSGEWYEYGGYYYASNTDGGSSQGSPTYGADFPSGVIPGLFMQYSADSRSYYSSSDTTYPFVVTGLPAGSYTLKMICTFKSGSDNSANNGNAEVHSKYGSGADVMSNTVAQKDNTQNEITFTGTITSGQVIRFGPYRNITTGGYTVISALIITKN